MEILSNPFFILAVLCFVAGCVCLVLHHVRNVHHFCACCRFPVAVKDSMSFDGGATYTCERCITELNYADR